MLINIMYGSISINLNVCNWENPLQTARPIYDERTKTCSIFDQ